MTEKIIFILIDNFIWLGIFALLLGIFYLALDPRRHNKLEKTLNKKAAKPNIFPSCLRGVKPNNLVI